MIEFWTFHALWTGRISCFIARQTSYPADDTRQCLVSLGLYKKSYLDSAVCTSIRTALYIGAASMSLQGL